MRVRLGLQPYSVLRSRKSCSRRTRDLGEKGRDPALGSVGKSFGTCRNFVPLLTV